MTDLIERKVALITGAASGIGACFARTLAAKEFFLVLADCNIDALKDQFSDLDHERVLLLQLDIRSYDGWQRVMDAAVKAFGCIDYLFNIAGITQPASILETEKDVIDNHLDVNARGAIYGSTIAAKIMKEQGQGHIISIASLAGLAAVPGLACYTASKFALRGFMLTAAIELREHNIFCTIIYPDLVKTPMYDYQLSLDKKKTAIVFSGSSKVLSVVDVEKALLRAMKKKSLEIAIPASRGVLSRLGGLLPNLAMKLNSSLLKKGEKNIEKLRKDAAQKA